MRIRSLSDLSVDGGIAPGNAVELAQPDREPDRFWFVGRVPAEIVIRLGWPSDLVWLREPERRYIEETKSGAFPDLIAAASFVISNPASVHDNPRATFDGIFVSTGIQLRRAGLLASQSAPWVDAIIRPMLVPGGAWLRLYHLSPATRNRGGRQRWP